MPLLDLKCNQCQKEYEYSKFRSDDEPACPSCGSGDYEKKISTGTGFALKGTGWAKDNYKTKKIR